MQKTLIFKLATIIVLCGLFLFGLLFVSGLVNERQSYYHTVMSDIEKTHVHQQLIATPFIVIPNHQNIYIPEFSSTTHMKSQAKVSDNDYKRGIYNAISYQNSLQIAQQYQFGEMLQNPIPEIQQTIEQKAEATEKTAEKNPTQKPPQRTNNAHYQWQFAKLIIPISDLRGVATLPTVTINGKNYVSQFPKKSELNGLNYIEVNLMDIFTDENKRKSLLSQPLSVDIKLNIAGISSINVLPLGQQFDLNLQADWTEPKFFGDALPTKQFSPAGFTATWQNQFLAISNNQKLTECLFFNQNCLDMSSSYTVRNITERATYDKYSTDSGSASYQWMSTAFVDSNNTYVQTDRTLKYALLLLIVSFATFFLFEILKQLRIHPVQYGLVAAALLVFYVLLLSFAEQIAFWQAYIIATIACVGLIGWYTSFVLHSVKRGAGFSFILGGLYAGFYLILASEDMNLLLGAIFCFVLLAVVMYLTRKIDWYQIENKPQSTIYSSTEQSSLNKE